jgi:HAD superfamily hydrolase (TIGR01484 family)
MDTPKAVLFDLDDTLAESFKPPRPEMVDALGRLLAKVPVAILTAAGFPRIERDFLGILARSPHIDRMYIFPNSAAECLAFRDDVWKPEYSIALSNEERARISDAMQAMEQNPVFEPHPLYPPRIIDRGAQVAFAALGLDAPLSAKTSFDPDQTKRIKMRAFLEEKAPGFEILIGGMTTIDVTKKGVNKAHGVRWLSEHLGIPAGKMLYIGDALYPGGNDAVVMETGIATRAITSPEETLRVINELLASL